MTPAKNPNEGHRSRLRKHFLKSGIDGLREDYEPLELLLTYAIPRRDTKELAKALLKRFGSIEKVFDASAEELREVPGMGEAAIVLILLNRDLCVRYLEKKIENVDLLDSVTKVVNFLRMKLCKDMNESFLVFYLTNQNQVIKIDTTDGTVGRAPVYPREIIKKCALLGASAVILAHNHPSGSSMPSPSDVESTKKIMAVLELIDVRLIDHIIVTLTSHTSLRGIGYLDQK